MTAYDPTFSAHRPGLLERLGLRAPPPVREIEDVAPARTTGAEGMDQTLSRIGHFLQLHQLDVSAFTLAVAQNQVLRREVETRIAKLEPVTIAWLKSISESEAEEAVDHFDRIFELLDQNISQFRTTTQSAQRATREYGAVLQSHAAELKKSDDGQRQLMQVATVVAAMVQRTKKLEDQLQESQKQANVLKQNLEDVQQKANQDHLTGLPNRRAFEKLYDEQVIAAQAEIEPLCVAFCDIDHFKNVNDTHGHDAGDRVLKVIARKLASISDDKCHVARHGGEEFVRLFRGSTLAPAVTMLDGLRQELSERRLVNRKTDQPIGRVTFSAGVADVFDFETPRAALAAADAALYEAKQQGRNQVLAASTEACAA